MTEQARPGDTVFISTRGDGQLQDVLELERLDDQQVVLTLSTIDTDEPDRLEQADRLLLRGLRRAFADPRVEEVVLRSSASPPVLFDGYGGEVRQLDDAVECTMTRADYFRLCGLL